MKTWRSRSLVIAVALGLAMILVVAAVVAQAASARATPTHAVTQSSSATAHTVTVLGHGEVKVAPDRATLTVGTESRAEDAKTAVSKNATKTQAVIAAIQAQGVPSNHIQTSNLSVYYDSQNSVYIAGHQLTVQIDRLNTVGAVLDAAVAAGADSSWGVSFSLADESAAKGAALRAAVADARKHADSIVSALGSTMTVTGVSSASEATYQSTPPPYAAQAPSPGTSTPVQPGELTVSADIKVVYTFG